MAAPASPEGKPAAAPPQAPSSPEILEFNVTPTARMTEQGPTSAGSAPEPAGLSLLVSKIKTTAATTFKDRKPWAEFLDRSSFSKPTSVSEATSRIQKNLAYYRTNYFIFFVAVMAITFLTSPRTLLWTGLLLAAWVYLFLVRTAPLVINGREYSDREKLIGMSAVTFVIVFFLTNVGTNVLYGTSLSLGMVALHGAFREPDDLFLDDPNAAKMFSGASNIFAGVQTLSGTAQV